VCIWSRRSIRKKHRARERGATLQAHSLACRVRCALGEFSKGYFLPLGPAYRREAGLRLGDLATLYRKNYLRWIDAARRSPDVRAQRIARFIELMKAGKKERPR
jgi:bacteriocin resistance YdeI/OmpD-like protein